MIRLADADDTDRVGRRLADLVMPGDVITLAGGLGAGKTSLARGLLAGLGLLHEAPSPSFAIVQPYDPPDVLLSVLHVDLYRIEAAEDLGELGLDETDDALLIVEWPERAGPGHWPHALALRISVDADGGRSLTADVPAAWKTRWPPR